MTARRSQGYLKNIAGAPLRAMMRLGGSPWAEKLHLQGPMKSILFHATRASVKAAVAGSTFVRRPATGDAQRLASSKAGGLFDLNPTEDQSLMRDAMRRFADEALRPAARGADDAAMAPEDLLAQGHSLGLAGLAIPEALGGGATERSSVTHAIIAEELARGDMGLAVALLSPLAVVHSIVAWGTAEQQARYLPPFLGNRFVAAALAVLEPRPLFDPM